MNRFGFNINMRITPQDIRNLGKNVLGTGLYHAIEVTYYENMEHVDTREYNEAIKELVSKYNPQVFVHISDFNLSEENSTLRKAILEEIKNCINYTRSLGGKDIVIHTGNCFQGKHVPIFHTDYSSGTREEITQISWKLSVELMQAACELAEGMNLYTENINADMNTRTTEQLVKYIRDVDRLNLKMVFDVGHCHLADYNMVSEILEAKEILAHLHIHDNHGAYHSGHLDEHAALGEGTINFEDFVVALQKVQYSGIYMMEIGVCTEEGLINSRNILLRTLERKN